MEYIQIVNKCNKTSSNEVVVVQVLNFVSYFDLLIKLEALNHFVLVNQQLYFVGVCVCVLSFINVRFPDNQLILSHKKYFRLG